MKRRFCLLLLRYTGSTILAVSGTENIHVRKIRAVEDKLTIGFLDPAQSGEVEIGRYLRTDGQLVVPAGRSKQLQTLHSEAAVVKARLLSLVRHTDVQLELLQ